MKTQGPGNMHITVSLRCVWPNALRGRLINQKGT